MTHLYCDYCNSRSTKLWDCICTYNCGDTCPEKIDEAWVELSKRPLDLTKSQCRSCGTEFKPGDHFEICPACGMEI